MQRSRRRRIGRRKPLIEPHRALLTSFLAQLGAQTWIAWRRVAQSLQEDSNIQPRAAHDQRQTPLSMQLFDELNRMALKQTGIERFIRVDEIEEVMGDALAGGDRRLVGSDIHSPIHLT